MLAKPLIQHGPVKMQANAGDVLDSLDTPIVSIDNSGGNVTLTGQQVAAQDLLFTGGTTPTNTLPTADQLLAALRGGLGINVPPANSSYGPNTAPEMQYPSNLGIIPPGTTFRRIFRNANSGTATVAAPASAGVTISGTATIATSVWREYVIRVLASAPAVTVSATTTNTSVNLTNISAEDIVKIQVGMSVYGTGIGASAVVRSVNLDTKTVVVSVASTATANNIGVSFTPTVEFVNLRAGSV